MAERVNADNFEEKVLRADKPVLLDFYSDTCIPCKRMAGPLADVEEDYEGKLSVYKVNVNYDGELAEKYRVMSAPTLVVFVNGEEKNRMSGAAGRDKIEELFSEYVQ
jgi:thioredoxin 1